MATPDRVFMKRLKELDPKLGCEWMPHLQRFMLTYERPVGGPVVFRVVETEDKEFRQPDMRDINWLHEHDTHKSSLKEQLNKASSIAADYKDKQERIRREIIHDQSKDNKYQMTDLHNKMFVTAKGHKHVRRIEPKAKGYTVKDLRKLKDNAVNS